MDPKLAEMYGTNQPNAEELEKMAAAELADGLAEEGQVDLNNLTEEDLETMAQEVLAQDEGEEGAEYTEQEKTSEAQEKLAEADYLGRVMAHAYVQELRGIEKEAAERLGPYEEGPAEKQHVPRETEPASRAKHGPDVTRTDKAMNKLRDVKSAIKAAPGQYGRAMRGSGAGGWKGALGMGAGGKRAAQVWGARGGTAAAAAGLAAGAHHMYKKHKEKNSSAMDTLVEARALEILEQSGIDPGSLQPVDQQEKTSAPANEVLGSAVEQRAWDLLGSYGVVPNGQE